MSRKIEVQILGDSKSLEAALGRAQTKTSSFGRALAVGAKVGAAGLLGLGVAAKIGFDEFSQNQKVLAQTNAVLKSTGNAANVTAGHVDSLASSISSYSGMDDEAVQAGENMLLTFVNIQNQAGRTNDVFDQATKVTADLAQAMGLDMTQAALQVGKALNDPAKGVMRLQRIGVQFSDDQVKLIKHLQDTGNTMEAQKLILGELTREFGGSAKAAGQTLPGQLKIAQESFRNLAGEIVGDLLPAMSNVAHGINTIVSWMRRNKGATEVLVTAIAGLSVALIAAKAAYALANSGLVRFLRSERVAAAASRALSVAVWLVNAALDANPVVLITAGIIALGVALVIAYKKSKTFRDVVHSAMSKVSSAVETTKGVFEGLWSVILDIIGSVRDLVNAIKSIPSLPSSIGGIHIPGLSGGLLNNVSVPGVGNARPMQVNLNLDGERVANVLIKRNKVYQRQNGRGMFS